VPTTVLLDIEKLRRSCKKRVPEKFADELRLDVTVRGKRVSIHGVPATVPRDRRVDFHSHRSAPLRG
jgi:hypothetical protein